MSETTYVQEGSILDYTAPANVSAGDIVVYGELIGQIVADALSGETVGLRVEGVIEGPKLSTDTPSAGAAIYWDDGNTRFTTTAASHKQAGNSVGDYASGTTTMKVRLGKR